MLYCVLICSPVCRISVDQKKDRSKNLQKFVKNPQKTMVSDLKNFFFLEDHLKFCRIKYVVPQTQVLFFLLKTSRNSKMFVFRRELGSKVHFFHLAKVKRQRLPLKFFQGGGKRHIHYLLDQLKPYSCNQDFAKGFEPKVKLIVFKKCCTLGGMLSKLMQLKCIMGGDLGAKPPVAEQCLHFFDKNNHFNAIWITFQAFLKPKIKTKLLSLRIYLKFLNCTAISALFICRLNSNHI